MKCPNCNVTLPKDSKYCPRCGLLFDSDDVKKFSEIFNTDFLDIYFPNKKVIFHIDRLSIGYALFTYLYAIYKKMYKIAINSFLVQIFIYAVYVFGSKYFVKSFGAMFYPIMFTIIGLLAIYFYYIFNFDRLLIENRTFKVNKILRENEGKSKEELIAIMENDSKNNIKGTIITTAIIVLFILIKVIFL